MKPTSEPDFQKNIFVLWHSEKQHRNVRDRKKTMHYYCFAAFIYFTKPLSTCRIPICLFYKQCFSINSQRQRFCPNFIENSRHKYTIWVCTVSVNTVFFCVQFIDEFALCFLTDFVASKIFIFSWHVYTVYTILHRKVCERDNQKLQQYLVCYLHIHPLLNTFLNTHICTKPSIIIYSYDDGFKCYSLHGASIATANTDFRFR